MDDMNDMAEKMSFPCSLRDIDICIVLSNALDNAILACKNMDAGTEKYIHVSGRIQGDFLMMEIRNSCQDFLKSPTYGDGGMASAVRIVSSGKEKWQSLWK